MLNKVLCAVVFFFFMGINDICFSEEARINAERLSADEAEFQFWKFFAEMDTVATYNGVIRRYFEDHRSKTDKLRGAIATVNLIKKRINDGGFLGIDAMVKNDEVFLNTFAWYIDNFEFKKYALPYILVDRSLTLEEKALLRGYMKILSYTINDSMLLRLFEKYKYAGSLKEEEVELLVAALVVSQGNVELLKDLDDIKDVVKSSSWSGKHKARITNMIAQIESNEVVLNKKDYIPETYRLGSNYRTSGALVDLMYSLEKEQVVELLKIAAKDIITFRTFFMKIDNIYVKEDILRILLSTYEKNLTEKFVVNILNIYRNYEFLSKQDMSVIAVTLANFRHINDKMVETVMNLLQTSKWFLNCNQLDILQNLIWLNLSYKNNNVAKMFIKVLIGFPVEYEFSYNVNSIEKYLFQNIDDKELLEIISKDIFNGYKKVSSLTADDSRILSRIIYYVKSYNDIGMAKDILRIIQESSWNTSSQEMKALEVAINSLNALVEGEVVENDACIKKFEI